MSPASFPGVSASREEKVAWAQARHADGLTWREIAAEAGLPLSTVADLGADPDRRKAKARRARYGGTCVDCGAPTDGSRGPRRASVRCAQCSSRHQHESARWTQEAIIGAMQAWAREHGEPPPSTEWMRSGPTWPTRTLVQRVFGSWSEAVAAAGLPALRRGQHRERTINCDGCGAEVRTMSPRARWCAECAKKARRNRRRPPAEVAA